MFLQRQSHSRRQPAPLAVDQLSVAAVGAGYRADDGQAEADASGLAVARGLASEEGLEYPLFLVLGDARAIVIDLDDGVAALGIDAGAGGAAVLQGVLDQVGDQTAQGDGIAL